MKTTAVLLMALCVAAHAQTAGTLTDTRDGKTYRTVKIGEQVWMGATPSAASVTDSGKERGADWQ